MLLNRINNLKNQGGSLKVSTNSSFGLLMDIRIIGMQPHGEGVIREIAKDARDIIAIRSLNKEHVGESQQQKKILRSLLQGITIIPMDVTRIFLQSTDHDLLTQFFGTEYFPALSFFRLDPHEIAFLENKDFEKSIRFGDGLQCWTREGKAGTYVHCDDGGDGGGRGGRGSRGGGGDGETADSVDKTPSVTEPPREGLRPINTRPGGEKGPKITFDPKINNNVNADLADIIENVARDTEMDLNISSTTGGNHAVNSDHYQGKAVDINRIDGERVLDEASDADIKAVQDAFRAYGNVGKNYGPQVLEQYNPKTGEWDPAPEQEDDHENHIHISIR